MISLAQIPEKVDSEPKKSVDCSSTPHESASMKIVEGELDRRSEVTNEPVIM